jgi:hypothetical protein
MRSRFVVISAGLLTCVIFASHACAQGTAGPATRPITPPGGGMPPVGPGSSSTNYLVVYFCAAALGFVSLIATLIGGTALGSLARGMVHETQDERLNRLREPRRYGQPERDSPAKRAQKPAQVIGGLVAGAVPIALACYFIPTSQCYVCSGLASLGVLIGIGVLGKMSDEMD